MSDDLEEKLESRITRGVIGRVVNPTKVDRVGYGTVDEYCKDDGPGSTRHFLIEMDTDEGNYIEDERKEDSLSIETPRLSELTKYLIEEKLYLAEATIKTFLDLQDAAEEGWKIRCLGIADVYELKEDKDKEESSPKNIPDRLPLGIG